MAKGPHPAASDPRHFALRRLHSLTGVVPIGVFLIEHYLTNSLAFLSAERFDAAARWLQSFPYVLILEVVGIWLPILFHGVLGAYIWWQGRSNVGAYPYAGNWLYTLQRVSGLVVLVFVLYHVWNMRIEGEPATFAKVNAHLSNPLVLAWNLVGVTAASFHFANGLWSFAYHWGITVGQGAQRRFGYACAAFGVLFTALGWLALLSFLDPSAVQAAGK
jgi:succinate dehydrogenase / fumarate reductase cytochrome b subunit